MLFDELSSLSPALRWRAIVDDRKRSQNGRKNLFKHVKIKTLNILSCRPEIGRNMTFQIEFGGRDG